MIPLYKNKDDIQYIDIKMLNYNICLKRMVETRVKRITFISKNQFRLTLKWLTIKAIHLVRRLVKQKRERKMKRNLHM